MKTHAVHVYKFDQYGIRYAVDDHGQLIPITPAEWCIFRKKISTALRVKKTQSVLLLFEKKTVAPLQKNDSVNCCSDLSTSNTLKL